MIDLLSLWPQYLAVLSIIAALLGFRRLAAISAETSEEKRLKVEAQTALRNAECPLIYAGKLQLLADHADELANYLQIHFIAPNHHGPQGKTKFIHLDKRHEFTDRFSFHQTLVASLSITGLEDKFRRYEVEENAYVSQIAKDLKAYGDNLRRCGAEAIKPYFESVRPRVTDAIR